MRPRREEEVGGREISFEVCNGLSQNGPDADDDIDDISHACEQAEAIATIVKAVPPTQPVT